MKKSDLIKSINEINDKICKLVEPNIQEVIRQYISNTSKYELVKSKDDIKGSVGFYMVFSSNRTFTKKACKIKHNGSDFYCVYRGHSYNTKERLISHLFYEQNSKYPNCMKIEINSKFYNINIGKKELYPNGNNEKFPKGEWIVIRIPLSNSKQVVREMFETAFDNKYGKPAFSKK